MHALVCRRFGCWILLGAALLAFASRSAKAALLGYDGFEAYTAGESLNGKTGGTGFAGAWESDEATVVAVIDKQLSYQQGDLLIDGGDRAVAVYGIGETSVNDNVANRPIATQTAPVYWSLLFYSDNAVDTNDFIQFILSDDNDHHNAASIGHRVNTNNGFFARIRDNTSDTHTTSGPAAEAGQTYFLVGRFSPVGSTYQKMEVWVNPNTATQPDDPSDYLAYLSVEKNSLANTLGHFLIRQAHYTSEESIIFDELRIGTSYEDVVTLVPEPGSLTVWAIGMASLAAAFFCRRGWRR